MERTGHTGYDSNYFIDTVVTNMQQMEFDPTVGFLAVGASMDGMPDDICTSASVEGSLIEYINTATDSRRPILLLLFPNRLPGIYVSSASIPRQLIDISLAKIRQYLRDMPNLQYMRAKLIDKLHNSEPAIESRINLLVEASKGAAEMIRRPSEFDFRFFASLTGFLLHDLVTNFERKVGSADLCRAAYIIGHLIIYYRGTVKAELDFELVIKGIERAFGRRPYIYTMEQLTTLQSDRGIPYNRSAPQGGIERFIVSRTHPRPDRSDPELYEFSGADTQQYYIARRSIPTFLIGERNRITTEIENMMIEDWHRCMERYDEPACMHNEVQFQKEVIHAVRNTHPYFEALLNYRLLAALVDNVVIPPAEREQVRQFLDPYQQKVRPIMEILHIDRRQIASRTRILSPFWKRFGPLKFLHRMARRFAEWRLRRQATRLQSPPPEETYIIPSPAATAATAGEPSDGLQKIAHTISGGARDLDSYMYSLVERWNTLLETQARRKLERDLDSLIRDYVHRMLHSHRNLRSINMATIAGWSELLTRSSMLSAISDKRSLHTYIQLKIIEQLRRSMVRGRMQ